MNLHEVDFGAAPAFDGYGPGFFRLGGQVFEGGLVVTPAAATAWSGLKDSAALVALADQVDFILLGMGADIAHPPADFRRVIEEAGLGLEVMSSPAACRTYNVLLGEGRRVAAAVLPVGSPERLE